MVRASVPAPAPGPGPNPGCAPGPVALVLRSTGVHVPVIAGTVVSVEVSVNILRSVLSLA